MEKTSAEIERELRNCEDVLGVYVIKVSDIRDVFNYWAFRNRIKSKQADEFWNTLNPKEIYDKATEIALESGTIPMGDEWKYIVRDVINDCYKVFMKP